jgi:hypothetical protein
VVLAACLSFAVMSTLVELQSDPHTETRGRWRPSRGVALDLGFSAAVVSIYAIFAANIVGAAHFFGLISAIYFATATACFAVYVGLQLRLAGIPVGTLLSIIAIISYSVVIFNGLPYELTQLPANIPSQIYEAAHSDRSLFDDHSIVFKERKIPNIEEAVRAWIDSRPDFETYTAGRKRKFPVFIVAAQGGGYYAGYHTALFLSRLQDRCPRFRSHLFAISGVSGGSLGGALFAQLGRAYGHLTVSPSEKDDLCGGGVDGPGLYEASVRKFFDFDFLSPVAASALFFDLPRLVVPHLSIGPSRTVALERAFEAAWDSVGAPSNKFAGFDKPFFGSWQATLDSPALFLNSTSVTGGIAALFSELHMTSLPTRERSPPSSSPYYAVGSAIRNFAVLIGDPAVERGLARAVNKSPEKRGLAVELLRAYRKDEEPRVPYFNVLDFRPDLQVPLSAAVVASASFPLITEGAVLNRSSAVAPRGEGLQATNQLLLVDGGFVDNSGLLMAEEVAERFVKVATERQLADKIEIHFLVFTHDRTSYYGAASPSTYPELVTPLATFEAIRRARGRALPRELPKGVSEIHAIKLFDRAFQPPLSWVLSGRSRQGIEIRSGGTIPGYQHICCIVDPASAALERNPILRSLMTESVIAELSRQFLFEFQLKSDEDASLFSSDSPLFQGSLLRTTKYVPNESEYRKLVDILASGGADVGARIKVETPAVGYKAATERNTDAR